jgi:hypothetical protein
MTQTEVLTKALVLALIAPTEDHATRASHLAEIFAQGLSNDEVDVCKYTALEQATLILEEVA